MSTEDKLLWDAALMSMQVIAALALLDLVLWHGECPVALAEAMREAREVTP